MLKYIKNKGLRPAPVLEVPVPVSPAPEVTIPTAPPTAATPVKKERVLSPIGTDGFSDIELTNMRKTIAKRLTESKVCNLSTFYLLNCKWTNLPGLKRSELIFTARVRRMGQGNASVCSHPGKGYPSHLPRLWSQVLSWEALPGPMSLWRGKVPQDRSTPRSGLGYPFPPPLPPGTGYAAGGRPRAVSRRRNFLFQVNLFSKTSSVFIKTFLLGYYSSCIFGNRMQHEKYS